jgi:molybdate transport system substrate-binding protein
MKSKKIVALLLCLLMVFAFAACGSGEAPAPADNGSAQGSAPAAETPEAPAITGNVMLAAAASLENTFVEELIPMFNAQNPEVTVTGTYASSGNLQEQIEGGLGATVFFSAAKKQMTALIDGGFVNEADASELLLNEVVLITRTGSDTKVTSFDNITDAASIAIGDPASVPAGQYAQEALTSLGTWDAVNAKASLGTDVTQVLNWVAEGSAEVGIVYATDAQSMADKVTVIAATPAGSLKTQVIYPIAKLANTPEADLEATEAFIAFLKSPEAMDVFEKYGFKAAA